MFQSFQGGLLGTVSLSISSNPNTLVNIICAKTIPRIVLPDLNGSTVPGESSWTQMLLLCPPLERLNSSLPSWPRRKWICDCEMHEFIKVEVLVLGRVPRDFLEYSMTGRQRCAYSTTKGAVQSESLRNMISSAT
jgi:hypothetical protein